MLLDSAAFDRAIGQFESELGQAEKGKEFYLIVIEGELNRPLCNKIANLYKQAGWATATCKTSSESGERPGLTGLRLTTTV